MCGSPDRIATQVSLHIGALGRGPHAIHCGVSVGGHTGGATQHEPSGS